MERGFGVRAWLLVTCLLVACGGGDEKSSISEPLTSSVAAIDATEEIAMEFGIPSDAELPRVSIGAETFAKVDEDVSIGGFVTANAGDVKLGEKSTVTGVSALGSIFLREHSTIDGNATATGEIFRAKGSKIKGQVSAKASLTRQSIAWRVQVPSVSSGDEILVEGQERDLVPGSYGHLVVPRDASVMLHSGVYRFETIDLHAGGKVLVDNEEGPVQAYAETELYLRGIIASADYGAPGIMFGYLGQEPIKLELPFAGQLVAPDAEVVIVGCEEEEHDDDHHCHRHDRRRSHPRIRNWAPYGDGRDERKGHKGDGHSSHDKDHHDRDHRDRDDYGHNGHGHVDNGPHKRSCTNAMLRGSVHSRSVTVGEHVQIEGNAFDWGSVVGPSFDPSTEGQLPVQMMNGSEIGEVRPSVSTDGTESGTRSIDFRRPRRFSLKEEHEVVAGVLANGTVDFKFRTPAGRLVTCEYRGSSSSSTPRSYEELNLGRIMRFVRCSDGRPFSARREATHIEMDLHPAPGLNVAVSPPVTNAGDCSEEFPLLPLSEIMRLRRDFDWSRQTKVAERNVDGTPTLYYAWIYIRNATESTALRKLYIHTLNRPLFMEELEPYRGRCGTFVNPGDGEGTFVPAVLPGATYNKLIEALTAADLSGDRTIFDVVRLREPPAAARNPNGSIRLDVLGKSGFGYLNYEKRIRDVDEIQLDSAPNVTKLIIDATVWVSDAVRTISREVQQVVAAIAAAFVGRVGITLEVHAINPDPAFTTAANPNPVMVHAWGTWAKARHELGALGMEVTILQQIPGVPLPALSTGKTDRAGKVFIDAVRDARPWENGLCLRHQTSAARVTDLFLASATCDFRAFGVTPNIPDTGNDFQLRDFSKSQALHLHTNMTRLTGLYQADDVWLWSNDVVKYKPRRARILTGYWAENLSKWFGTGGQSTPCLGYTGITPDLLSLAEGSTGILTAIGYGLGTPLATIASSVFLSALTSADIIMPANGSSTLARDRTVMSHEYGHYLFCSLLNDFSNADVAPVEHLAYQALGSGGADRSQSATYTNEAMADFIDGQVTGGANYAWTNLVTNGSFTRGKAFCADPSLVPVKASEGQCFDFNLSGTANTVDDNQSIGRVITLVHDAFDGHHDRFGLTPSDGDVWLRPMPLTVSPTPFATTDEAYERVALDGPALTLFASFLGNRMGVFGAGSGIKDSTVYGALGDTMRARGYNWCERCRVFALHSPLVSTQVRDGTLTPGDLFAACGNDPLIRNVMEANPTPDFRFDWETCAPCPATSTWSNGQCIPCPNRVVDNECIVCPSDIVLQGAELMSDNYATTFSVPGDKCPDTFIVQVNNPSASIHDTQTGFTFEVGPRVVTDADCRQNFTMFAERSNGSELSLDATFSAMGRSNCGTGTIGCPCFDTPEVSYNAGNINGAAFVRVGTPANAKNLLSIILDGPDEGGPH